MRSTLLVITLLLASCGDVRSFEETSAQFDRDQLQPLADAALACESAAPRVHARESERTDCIGDIARQLHRLGFKSALIDSGNGRVALVNGDDGTGALGSVMSGIEYHRTPGLPPPGLRPLTESPYQWFYFQHD